VNLEHKTGTPQASEWPEDATCSRITANSIVVAIKDREVRQPTKTNADSDDVNGPFRRDVNKIGA
jgi:hypothetical protein